MVTMFPGKPPPVVPVQPAHAMVADDLDLGGGEHLRIIDIPDRALPYRCLLFTAAGHSTLHCLSDSVAP